MVAVERNLKMNVTCNFDDVFCYQETIKKYILLRIRKINAASVLQNGITLYKENVSNWSQVSKYFVTLDLAQTIYK